ncbi:MAG: HlyD family efflux transporter periplasmic adaptor subunit [Elusimicrobia bacterium]|nr:HlyD family efflux transporter periplasmic adaptor subunit [Elusimicrobiota bacterium]
MDQVSDDREKLEQYFSQIKLREKKLRELQEKFEELIPQLTVEALPGNGVPEIVENIDVDRRITEKTSRVSSKRNILASLLIGGVVIISLALAKFDWTVKTYGEALPANRLIMRAPFDGFLNNLYSKEGDKVEQGSIVAEIRNDDLILDISKQSQELRIVSSQVDLVGDTLKRLRETLERKQRLRREGIIPVMEVEKTQNDYDEALIKSQMLKRDRTHLETSVELLKDKINQTKLVAPMRGIIVTHNLDKSNKMFFEKGEKICEIADLSRFVIEASIPEAHIRKMAVGQEAYVKFDAYSKWHKGKVIKIAEFSGLPSRTIEELLRRPDGDEKKGIIATIELSEEPRLIKYGMNARVKIVFSRASLFEHLMEK